MSWLIPSSITSLNPFRAALPSALPQENSSISQEPLTPAEEAYEAIDKTSTSKFPISCKLEELASEVNSVIGNETQVGVDARNRSLVEVAIKVCTLINNSLNNNVFRGKKWDELDKMSRLHLGNICLLVDKLKSKNDLLAMDTEATRLMDELPLDYPESRVKGFSPQYVFIPATAKTVKVTLLGDFNSFANLAPVLIPERDLMPSQASKSRLDYEIDVSQLVFKDQPKDGVFRYVKLFLKAGWNGIPLLRSSSLGMHFPWLGILPQTVGKVEVVYKAQVDGELLWVRKTDVMHLPSKEDSMTFRHIPTKDWVFSNEPHIRLDECNKNACTVSCKSLKDGYSIEIVRNEKPQFMDPIFFRISHKEQRTVKAGEERSEIFDLCWDRLTQLVPAINEKVDRIVLKAFNGQTFTFQPRYQVNHPFLKVFNHTGDIYLEAPSANSNNADFVNVFKQPQYDEEADHSTAAYLKMAHSASIAARMKQINDYEELLQLEAVQKIAYDELVASVSTPVSIGFDISIHAQRKQKVDITTDMQKYAVRNLEARKRAVQESLLMNNQREKEFFSGYRKVMEAHYSLPVDLLDQLSAISNSKKDKEEEEKKEKETR